MMNEEAFITHLLGPNGGVFAFGMIFGAILMWVANLKILIPYRERAHKAEISAIEAKMEAIVMRVNQLEQFEKLYWEIMREHAHPSLHPKRRQEDAS